MCQYAGEVLSTVDARRRLAEYDRLPDTAAGHALLVRPAATLILHAQAQARHIRMQNTRVSTLIWKHLKHPCVPNRWCVSGCPPGRRACA